MPPKKKKKSQNGRKKNSGPSTNLNEQVMCFYSAPAPKYILKPVVGYEDHCLSKYRNPAYSIAAKRRPMEAVVSAGPGPIYLPQYQRADGFSIGMPFTREKIESSTPGPYFLPSPTPGPAFTIKSRMKPPEISTLNAGPYDIRRNLNGPSFSIGHLLPQREEIREGPLPRMTNVDFVKPRPPAFSLSFRLPNPDLSNVTPRPYDPVDLDKGPSFSFGTKHNPCFVPFITSCDKMQ